MISVIMPSYLGDYKGAATNRPDKFRRAVDSFLSQTYKECELIIVGDGCPDTEFMMEMYYNGVDNVKFIRENKQELFSGHLRNAGIKEAKYRYITYLDTDDYYLPLHLENITNQIGDCDIPKFNWYIVPDLFNKRGTVKERTPNLQKGCIGTSNIIHKASVNIKWTDGYNHDWLFIQDLMTYDYKRIGGAGYVVCHMPNVTDE